MPHTPPPYLQIGRYIESLKLGQGRLAGQPFRLVKWQRSFLKGTFTQDDDSALSIARGNGKTTLVAALGCAAVDVDGPLVEPGAESIIVASSFSQGLIAFRHVLHFLRPSLEKHGVGPRGRFRVQDSANRASITDRETGAMLSVLGSDPKRLHGGAFRLAVLDEVSQWPSASGQMDKMLAAIETSRGKVKNSKVIWIGTRPATPSHPFEKMLTTGSHYKQVHAARPDDPPFERRTWGRANPSLPSMPDLEHAIRKEAARAKIDPWKLAQFESLRLNMGVSDTVENVLLDAGWWKKIEERGPAMPVFPYVLGIDLGSSAAMSAAAAYYPLTGRLEAFAVFPTTPDLRQRGIADSVGSLYTRMERNGELVTAGEYVSDVGALLREVLERWGAPGAIVCDRWREAELRQALSSAGFPLSALVVRGAGFRDGGEDMRQFEEAALDGGIVPVPSLLMRSAMSEARAATDPAGNRKLAKNSEGGRRGGARDDAVAAAILAVAEGRRRDKPGAGTRELVSANV